jgi:nucleotide-binding universal stress UspA family protein
MARGASVDSTTKMLRRRHAARQPGEIFMSSRNQPTVMVGVSGSVASAAALRWAADEAGRRGARLRVIRSWDPQAYAPYAPAAGRPAPGQQRDAAGEELAALMCATFGSPVPEGVTMELAQGNAERLLVDCSAEADLLVLGSAAPAASRARSIGPVIRTCLSRAHCPVVVVSPAEQETARTGRLTERRHPSDREKVLVPVS